MAPSWKRTVHSNTILKPISDSIAELQLSFTESVPSGTLTNGCVLLALDPQQADLLESCCFGVSVLSSSSLEVNKLIQLSFEEAYYLLHVMKCIKIIDFNGNYFDEDQTWVHMKTEQPRFPFMFKAYSDLRSNWVVQSGSKYGVDFTLYRHRPEYVHSEYTVLVQHVNNNNRSWFDITSSVRLSRSVSKALLIANVFSNSNNEEEDLTPNCLKNYTLEIQTIRHWTPDFYLRKYQVV